MLQGVKEHLELTGLCTRWIDRFCLDILEIVDGAGDECESVVEAGVFGLRFVKAGGEGEGEGEGEGPAAEAARRYHLSRSSRPTPCSGVAGPSLRSAWRPTARSGPKAKRVPRR